MTVLVKKAKTIRKQDTSAQTNLQCRGLRDRSSGDYYCPECGRSWEHGDERPTCNAARSSV